MKNILFLVMAVVLGIASGLLLPEQAVEAVSIAKQILGEIIFFLVPLIILAFVAPSIASLKGSVSRLLVVAFAIAYLSSIGAATFGAVVGYHFVPLLNIEEATAPRTLPEALFTLEIPPVMSVMSAILLAILLGLGCVWSNAQTLSKILSEFRELVLRLVDKILLPLLPLYVACNFSVMAYEGNVERFWVFLPVLLVVIICHFVWLGVLYGLASIVSGKNAFEVVRHYGPAYLTALGTMSSAATLGVALECAHRSKLLRSKIVDFAVSLFANIHLCGSVLTEVFFACVVSQLLYGALPAPSTLALFIVLFGIFAIGAPGVPGGTVLASLGLVVSVLGFDDSGTALLIAIFALQDSFGTACNVLGDGALTTILQKVDRQ